MAGGLGLLFSGLAGASKGLATGLDDEQQTADRMKLETLRSNLEEQKALRIAEAGRVATRQAGIQQGQDIDSSVNQMQNQRDAEAINAANAGVEGGSNMSAADAAVLRNQPEARKAYGLLNPTRQSDLEDRANAAEKLGYLDAARETRGALQTEVANQRNKDVDASTNRRLDQQDERQASLDKYNQRREDRLDRLATAQLSFQQARAGKEDARSEQMAEREQRNATVAAMKGAETDAKALQKEMADPMLAPEQKTVLQSQLDTARADARRFRNALGGAGIEGGGAPDKPFNPADFRTNKSGGSTPVKQGGTTVPNPIQQDAPVSQASPKDLAVRGIDTAINDTVRALAAAGNRGDKAESERLNNLLQEQQAAKARM